jgi:hypothetical protein
MAAAVSVITSSASSLSTQSSGVSAPDSVTEAQNAPTHGPQTGVGSDLVSFSRASTLLSQVEQQLKKTPQTSVTQVLNNAATNILAQAQSEHDPHQAKILENLATRLQVAASSGVSALPPYSLTSLLGG